MCAKLFDAHGVDKHGKGEPNDSRASTTWHAHSSEASCASTGKSRHNALDQTPCGSDCCLRYSVLPQSCLRVCFCCTSQLADNVKQKKNGSVKVCRCWSCRKAFTSVTASCCRYCSAQALHVLNIVTRVLPLCNSLPGLSETLAYDPVQKA